MAAPQRSNSQRREKLQLLVEQYDVDPERQVQDEALLAPLLAGDTAIERFALVSLLGEDRRGVPRFVIRAQFGTVAAALDCALEGLESLIYPEIPIAVVMLDTGKRHVPDWRALTWSLEPHASAV